jgi:protein FAM32A
MSDYEYVSRSSLKLKTTDGMVKKKSKKKNKNKSIEQKLKQMIDKRVDNKESNDSIDQKSQTVSSTTSGISANKGSIGGQEVWMTSAEKKFLAQQEKRQISRVMTKASKSHKQRVEEFNRHLENLTEHYDIPKVSWTK